MSARNPCIYLFVAAFAASACRAEKHAAFDCPSGFGKNGTRQSEIFAALTSTDEGKQIYKEAESHAALRFCFGPIAVSSVTTEGALLLDEELGSEEAAARVGHLLRHVRDGLSAKPKDGERCEEMSERLLGQEAEALTIELELRQTLAVKTPKIRYEIEPAWRSKPPQERVALVLDYLKAHPNGAPGIEPLARGYERRCRLGLP